MNVQTVMVWIKHYLHLLKSFPVNPFMSQVQKWSRRKYCSHLDLGFHSSTFFLPYWEIIKISQLLMVAKTVASRENWNLSLSHWQLSHIPWTVFKSGEKNSTYSNSYLRCISETSGKTFLWNTKTIQINSPVGPQVHSDHDGVKLTYSHHKNCIVPTHKDNKITESPRYLGMSYRYAVLPSTINLILKYMQLMSHNMQLLFPCYLLKWRHLLLDLMHFVQCILPSHDHSRH